MPRGRERKREKEREREMKMQKKGPWTVAEDTVLVEYITKHGEGNWNTVERNSGLNRCGKSCRLRWFNHLRPNLKRGAFSPEEERIVVEMHAQFGNRWARMAMKLPGRSDNEIKNFWNTRAKRLERAGLPLYPEGLIARHHPIRHRNQNHTPTQFVSPNETHFSNRNLDFQNLEFKLAPNLSMGPFSYSRPTNPTPIIPNSSFSHYSSYPINGNGNNFSIGSSSNYSPFSSIPSSSTMSYPFQSQSYNLNPNPNPNPNPPLSMSNLFEPQCLFSNSEGELSLIQSLLDPPPTANYEPSNEANFTEMANFYDPQYSFTPLYSNDGLLEDICGVNQTLAAPNDEGNEICIWDGDFSSSPNASLGMQIVDPIEEMFPLDDDISALLENIPMDFLSPDW